MWEEPLLTLEKKELGCSVLLILGHELDAWSIRSGVGTLTIFMWSAGGGIGKNSGMLVWALNLLHPSQMFFLLDKCVLSQCRLTGHS